MGVENMTRADRVPFEYVCVFVSVRHDENAGINGSL